MSKWLIGFGAVGVAWVGTVVVNMINSHKNAKATISLAETRSMLATIRV